MPSRKLLILDLDETLIYAAEKPLPHAPDFLMAQYSVYMRPFLDIFLEAANQWYELAVWTSASESYARAIQHKIFPDAIKLSFLWTHRRCVNRFDFDNQSHYFVKDLRKVKRSGYNLEQILILDDSAEKVERHYGNRIPIKPFYGDMEDTKLRDIIPFLDQLRSVENVRKIEKRRWCKE